MAIILLSLAVFIEGYHVFDKHEHCKTRSEWREYDQQQSNDY